MYTQSNWTDDKILIAKLVSKKYYDKAKSYLQDVYLVTADPKIANSVSGMLFILDIISPDKRYK